MPGYLIKSRFTAPAILEAIARGEARLQEIKSLYDATTQEIAEWEFAAGLAITADIVKFRAIGKDWWERDGKWAFMKRHYEKMGRNTPKK